MLTYPWLASARAAADLDRIVRADTTPIGRVGLTRAAAARAALPRLCPACGAAEHEGVRAVRFRRSPWARPDGDSTRLECRACGLGQAELLADQHRFEFRSVPDPERHLPGWLEVAPEAAWHGLAARAGVPVPDDARRAAVVAILRGEP